MQKTTLTIILRNSKSSSDFLFNEFFELFFFYEVIYTYNKKLFGLLHKIFLMIYFVKFLIVKESSLNFFFNYRKYKSI